MKKIVMLLLGLTMSISSFADDPEYEVMGWGTSFSGNKWGMTKHADNKYYYIATSQEVSFEGEYSTYTYKYRAYNTWDGYKLPGGNDNFYFTFNVAGTYDIIFNLNTSKHSQKVIAVNPTTSDVALPNSYENNFSVTTKMVKGDGYVYTKDLDLTNTLEDVEFKLHIAANNDWIGFNGLTLDDEESMVEAVDGDGSNFRLKNSNMKYKTYRFTATVVPGEGWKLKVEGIDLRETATITRVGLWGSFNSGSSDTDTWNWINLTKTSENTWTGTINLSNWSDNKLFKVVVFDNDEHSEWFGATSTDLAYNGTDGLVENNADPYALKLNHASTDYATYNVTATWESSNLYNKRWTLTITGKDKVENTVTFTKPDGWGDIYIYTWTGDTKQCGEWPGKNTTIDNVVTINHDDKVYTFTFYGKTYPENVIFNDGSNQTSDFTFCPNAKYTDSGIVAVAAKIGASGFATFSSNQKLDFSTVATSVKAYAATLNESKVLLKEITKVPANTGILLIGTANTDVYIPVTTEDPSDGDASVLVNNKLVASVTATEVDATDGYNYVLSTDNEGNTGFYKITKNIISKAGKAYLHTDEALATEGASSRVVWSFDDETTGINQIENAQPATAKDAVIYNLNGQRVMNPAKGLYIVNGKKVIIK